MALVRLEPGMTLFMVKATITPLMIAMASLAARRWGPAVGGWVAGLPLTSGPVSVFLALEQGHAFAAHAACGTLLGLISFGAFCVAYARSARISKWVISVICGLGVYSVFTAALSLSVFSLVPAALLVLGLLGVALVVLGAPASVPRHIPLPWWDLPMRMATATAFVVLITGAARAMGPNWSGLLSPFPVFACVMAVFTHRNGGSDAAQRLLRGFIIGSFSCTAFFVVVGVVIERSSLITTYALASAVALLVNGFSLMTLVGRQRAP